MKSQTEKQVETLKMDLQESDAAIIELNKQILDLMRAGDSPTMNREDAAKSSDFDVFGRTNELSDAVEGDSELFVRVDKENEGRTEPVVKRQSPADSMMSMGSKELEVTGLITIEDLRD